MIHDLIDEITDPSLDDYERGALALVGLLLLPIWLVAMAIWLPLTLFR